jgi:GR25 family glycosyltransferase involved in LPS biosynthesis
MLSDKLAIVGEMDFSGTAAYYITSNTKKTILNALANDVQPLCACDKFLQFNLNIKKQNFNDCITNAIAADDCLKQFMQFCSRRFCLFGIARKS